MHTWFGGQDDQETDVKPEDPTAVSLDPCNSVPHLLNLFTEPY